MDVSDVREAVSVAGGKDRDTAGPDEVGRPERPGRTHRQCAVRVACPLHIHAVHSLHAAHCLFHKQGARGKAATATAARDPGWQIRMNDLRDPLRLVGTCQLLS